MVESGWYYALQNGKTRDIWIGGDRARIDHIVTTDDSTIDPACKKNLTTVLPMLFSDQWISGEQQVHGVWSGVMAYTGDELPFVGKLPSSLSGRPGQGEWVAVGWNSYGMANCLSTGEAVAKMILGEDVSDWFPEAYLISEERLKGPSFRINTILKNYFRRNGGVKYTAEI